MERIVSRTKGAWLGVSVLTLVLPGCGDNGPSSPSPSPSPTTGACAAGPVVPGMPALASQLVVGGLRTPVDLQAPPGDRERLLVVGAGRTDPRRSRGSARRGPLSRHLVPDQLRRRARAARPRPPPAVRDQPQILRELHRHERRHEHLGVPRHLRRRRGPRQRAAASLRRSALRQPQRRRPRLRQRRLPLHRPGRRRVRRRPLPQRPEPRDAARQDAADRRGPRLSVRGATGQSLRLHAPAPSRRSGPSACATPGASPSTARPGTCTSATSARTAARRSTSASPPAAAARTTAGAHGGVLCYPGGEAATRAASSLPVLEYGHDEGCSVTGGVVYRGCRMPGYAGTYFYGDYCEGFVRSFRLEGGRPVEARDSHRDRGPRDQLRVVLRGRPGRRDVRGRPRRRGLPHRPCRIGRDRFASEERTIADTEESALRRLSRFSPDMIYPKIVRL